MDLRGWKKINCRERKRRWKFTTPNSPLPHRSCLVFCGSRSHHRSRIFHHRVCSLLIRQQNASVLLAEDTTRIADLSQLSKPYEFCQGRRTLTRAELRSRGSNRPNSGYKLYLSILSAGSATRCHSKWFDMHHAAPELRLT